MIATSTTVRSTQRVRCTVLGTCYLRMDSATKGCSIRDPEMALGSLSISQGTSTRENTGKALGRAKESLRQMMESFMKAVGTTIRCMAEGGRRSRMVNALSFITRMVISLRPLQAKPQALQVKVFIMIIRSRIRLAIRPWVSPARQTTKAAC